MEVLTPKELKDKVLSLPYQPGVYLMKDKTGTIIYVGKAKKLKNRVSSYFRGEHLPKVAAMVEKVKDFNVIIADSEFEALVLENSLIKRHKPKYNILLKDDKGYPFIRIDLKDEYPVMKIISKTAKDGAKYFGPFGGRSQTGEIIDTLLKTFHLPTCSRHFPMEIGKERPCLNYHMGLCDGWCLGKKEAEEYRRTFSQAMLILDGKSGELIAKLHENMEFAAEELRFEQAAEYRDRINAITALSNKQKVISTAFADTDAIGFFRGAKTCFTVLHFVNGDLIGKDVEMIDDPIECDCEALSDLIMQYYGSHRGGWPKSVILPYEIEDRETLENILSELAGRRIYIEVPQRGDKHKLVQSAMINASEEVLRRTTASQRTLKTLEWLQKTLKLDTYPDRIEAFDISNLGDTGIVAGMTVFQNGKPLKKAYKKFRIRELETRDDYASMYQAVYRRFERALDGDENFKELPKLLLIDGGDKHAATAEKALEELGMKIPVFGMVKDDRHRTRELVRSDGQEIGIQSNQAVFALIGSIQEETHRFTIDYQRRVRNEGYASVLDKIDGIGPKRRTDLIKSFKSIKAISAASVEQLSLVVPQKTAVMVYDYFHNGEEKQ